MMITLIPNQTGLKSSKKHSKIILKCPTVSKNLKEMSLTSKTQSATDGPIDEAAYSCLHATKKATGFYRKIKGKNKYTEQKKKKKEKKKKKKSKKKKKEEKEKDATVDNYYDVDFSVLSAT